MRYSIKSTLSFMHLEPLCVKLSTCKTSLDSQILKEKKMLNERKENYPSLCVNIYCVISMYKFFFFCYIIDTIFIYLFFLGIISS